MTDTIAARPDVPAWLNIDAVIPEPLRGEMLAHADTPTAWLDQCQAWADRTVTLLEEFTARLADNVGPSISSEDIYEPIETACGYDQISDVITSLRQVVERMERAAVGETIR